MIFASPDTFKKISYLTLLLAPESTVAAPSAETWVAAPASEGAQVTRAAPAAVSTPTAPSTVTAPPRGRLQSWKLLYSVPSRVWSGHPRHLCHATLQTSARWFDDEGQLDSIAPKAPSTPTARRGRNYPGFFKIFMNIGTERCPHSRWYTVYRVLMHSCIKAASGLPWKFRSKFDLDGQLDIPINLGQNEEVTALTAQRDHLKPGRGQTLF